MREHGTKIALLLFAGVIAGVLYMIWRRSKEV